LVDESGLGNGSVERACGVRAGLSDLFLVRARPIKVFELELVLTFGDAER
jgi:hypothetical protein